MIEVTPGVFLEAIIIFLKLILALFAPLIVMGVGAWVASRLVDRLTESFRETPLWDKERQKYGPLNDALLEVLREEKPKNDDLEEKPKRGRVFIGDDGELMEEIEK